MNILCCFKTFRKINCVFFTEFSKYYSTDKAHCHGYEVQLLFDESYSGWATQLQELINHPFTPSDLSALQFNSDFVVCFLSSVVCCLPVTVFFKFLFILASTV